VHAHPSCPGQNQRRTEAAKRVVFGKGGEKIEKTLKQAEAFFDETLKGKK
jgi:hypothetical protein